MAEAYVPLCYAPGEAYQFDWSHEIVLIQFVTTTVKVAHVRLYHSRMMRFRACRMPPLFGACKCADPGELVQITRCGYTQR